MQIRKIIIYFGVSKTKHSMTKPEAIGHMMLGKKVTHRHFDSKEWMTIESGKIVLEDGVKCSPEEFWRWRKDASWEDGYSLKE